MLFRSVNLAHHNTRSRQVSMASHIMETAAFRRLTPRTTSCSAQKIVPKNTPIYYLYPLIHNGPPNLEAVNNLACAWSTILLKDESEDSASYGFDHDMTSATLRTDDATKRFVREGPGDRAMGDGGSPWKQFTRCA